MALKRMDKVGIVVDDLGKTIDFFRELGLELEGRATIEGEWAGRVTGLADQRVEIAMMRTPDGIDPDEALEVPGTVTPKGEFSQRHPSPLQRVLSPRRPAEFCDRQKS